LEASWRRRSAASHVVRRRRDAATYSDEQRADRGEAAPATGDTPLDGARPSCAGPRLHSGPAAGSLDDGWRLAVPGCAFIDPLPYTVTVVERSGSQCVALNRTSRND